MIGSGMPPYGSTSSVSCSAMSCAVRSTMRCTPVVPTNMWCASSFSMKVQVRANGSKPLSLSVPSWYLPSRSVKYVNMKNCNQSVVSSLNAPRMRGLSKSPLLRLSSSSASSRPSRPKYAWSR